MAMPNYLADLLESKHSYTEEVKRKNKDTPSFLSSMQQVPLRHIPERTLQSLSCSYATQSNLPKRIRHAHMP